MKDGRRLIKFYEKMYTIRIFEKTALQLYDQGLIRGVIHPYIGEEAIAVGVCEALKPNDYIVSTHRGHGHCIAKGAQTNKMMAELLGRVTGYCKGWGGSMHIADFSSGILGATGVVGAGIPVAVGAALSIKLRKTDQVTACFFGDGAVNQGTFHESLNLASIWKLPVIFICENNQYAISTPIKEVISVPNIADRASAYGMPGYIVNGNEVIEVYEVAQKLVENVRHEKRPVLLEAKTYRLEGHYRGDPENYRPREEVNRWKEKDPILSLRRKLVNEGLFSEKELKSVEKKVESDIEKAEKFAKKSPLSIPEESMRFV